MAFANVVEASWFGQRLQRLSLALFGLSRTYGDSRFVQACDGAGPSRGTLYVYEGASHTIRLFVMTLLRPATAHPPFAAY